MICVLYLLLASPKPAGNSRGLDLIRFTGKFLV